MAKASKTKGSKKAKFRDVIRENARDFYEKDFDELNSTEMSHCMTRTYVETIAKHKYPELMPTDDEEYEQCHVDGPNDIGIDFISRQNSTVVIIQSKYHTKKFKTAGKEDFVNFCEVLKRLYSGKHETNEKLAEAASEIDWETDTFILEFNSLSKANDTIRNREDEGISDEGLPDGFSERVTIQFQDEEDLNTEYRSYREWSEGIKKPLKIKLAQLNEDNHSWLVFNSSNNKRKSYIGIINGKQLRELYKPKDVKNRLFSENIRNPMGLSMKVNKDMRETAINNCDEFFFLNNGISAIATSINENEKECTLTCENFSIINGAQTVLALVKPPKKGVDSEPLGNSHVLIRITKISQSDKEKEQSFKRNIVKYNNTQNKIVAADFCSNDPIQYDLENKFSKLDKLDGKAFIYIRKRLDLKILKGYIKITIEDFAKYLHAFQFGPGDVFGGTPKLFDSISQDGRYKYIYGDGEKVFERFENDQFMRLAGLYFLCKKSLEVFKPIKLEKINEDDNKKKADANYKALARNALYSRPMFLFTLGTLCRENYKNIGEDLDSCLQKLSKLKNFDNPKVMSILEEYIKGAISILLLAYHNAETKPEFNLRNWLRSHSTLEEIKIQCSSLVGGMFNAKKII